MQCGYLPLDTIIFFEGAARLVDIQRSSGNEQKRLLECVIVGVAAVTDQRVHRIRDQTSLGIHERLGPHCPPPAVDHQSHELAVHAKDGSGGVGRGTRG